MSWFSGIGKYFGVSPKGEQMSTEDSATEDSIQAALDKLVTGNKAFGNRTMSASDAEKQLTAQGVLPPGWRLRESDSTSSGYRPTQAATKTMGAIHAGQVAAAAFTGGASLAGSGIGLATNAAIQGGLGAAGGVASGGGVKGALLGGALGAGGAYLPVKFGGANLAARSAVQGGLGAAGGLAAGGDLRSALLGGAMGAAAPSLGRVAPAVTGSALGQRAVNYGIDTGVNAARTGSFDPRSVALGAAGTFLPSATNAMTNNPLGQRLLSYGTNQGLGALTGRFSPLTAGVEAVNAVRGPKPRKTVYGDYLG